MYRTVTVDAMRRMVLLLLVLPLAACGGSSRLSKHAYELQLQAAGRKAQHASESAAGSTARAKLKAAHDEMEASADSLAGVKPPADAEADNAKIVAGLRYLADEIGKLQTAATPHDTTAAARVSSDIIKSKVIAGGARAAKDLQRKGYSVGIFAG
jgi:hypothetical protein